MKRAFKLNGLDCANCAAKMEAAVAKLPGVTSVNINFMTTKMVLETEDGQMDSVLEYTVEAIQKIEPDVELVRA